MDRQFFFGIWVGLLPVIVVLLVKFKPRPWVSPPRMTFIAGDRELSVIVANDILKIDVLERGESTMTRWIHREEIERTE